MRYFLVALILPVLVQAQPPPPQAAGYQLVFSDSFDRLSLSSAGYGDYAWYPAIPWNAALPPPSLITAKDSALQLTWKKNRGLNDVTISTAAHDASHYRAYRYGYFEARMQWDVTAGAWPAFWMCPIQVLGGATTGGEIDIFEGQGSAPRIFYGTVHVWEDTGKTETFNQGCACKLAADNNFAAWHKYGVLWVPGKMKWYYDDTELYSVSVPAIFDQQDYFLMLGSQEGVNWTYGNLQGVTADSVRLNVDWMRVWQLPRTPSGARTRR
jgi:beta-glucanase (GH16 family)